MILSVTLSKPVKNIQEILGRPYIRVKIRANSSASGLSYFAESFTEKQAFHEQMTEQQLADYIAKHAGKTFRNCIERTETEEITMLANKKGEVTTLRKAVKPEQRQGDVKAAAPYAGKDIIGACRSAQTEPGGFNRTKKYILQENVPVPFLVLLGVMTPEGKVVASRYDKFRQINRFLEFIDDILPDVQKAVGPERPIRIADFGCGKSYLTFAVYHYLVNIKNIRAEITGLDLKQDVIEFCSRTAEQLGYTGLTFATGNIADHSYAAAPDMVITLHACDTATDFALDYAVKHGCTAIISVPCCQHELNGQIDKGKASHLPFPDEFMPLLRYGIIKERFAALATDALRASYLEQAGYAVQMLEFIDMEHTPKNLLIRAVKRSGTQEADRSDAKRQADALTAALHVSPALRGLLEG